MTDPKVSKVFVYLFDLLLKQKRHVKNLDFLKTVLFGEITPFGFK